METADADTAVQSIIAEPNKFRWRIGYCDACDRQRRDVLGEITALVNGRLVRASFCQADERHTEAVYAVEWAQEIVRRKLQLEAETLACA